MLYADYPLQRRLQLLLVLLLALLRVALVVRRQIRIICDSGCDHKFNGTCDDDGGGKGDSGSDDDGDDNIEKSAQWP